MLVTATKWIKNLKYVTPALSRAFVRKTESGTRCHFWCKPPALWTLLQPSLETIRQLQLRGNQAETERRKSTNLTAPGLWCSKKTLHLTLGQLGLAKKRRVSEKHKRRSPTTRSIHSSFRTTLDTQHSQEPTKRSDGGQDSDHTTTTVIPPPPPPRAAKLYAIGFTTLPACRRLRPRADPSRSTAPPASLT